MDELAVSYNTAYWSKYKCHSEQLYKRLRLQDLDAKLFIKENERKVDINYFIVFQKTKNQTLCSPSVNLLFNCAEL